VGRFGWTVLALSASAAAAQDVDLRGAGAPVERVLAPTGTQTAALRLRRGESADVVVRQEGIDVVVELFGPEGRLIESVDSPNGRQGDEPVSILADRSGRYLLRIRPISAQEPAGRIRIGLVALRDRAATSAAAAARRREEDIASLWLRARGAPLRLVRGAELALGALPPLERLAGEAQVIGLGEATHGSREIGDVRLAMVKRLVERHGFRLIALEDSTVRWRRLAGYVSGAAADSGGHLLEWGWIGRRPRRALLEWVRAWNLAHPADPVRIVGLDPQSNDDLALLEPLVREAYGEAAAASWREAAAELAAAAAQSEVFGNSSVSLPARTAAVELFARLSADQPLLRGRLGEERFDRALEAARDAAQFADFNAGGGPLGRSRDWYMATNLLAAMGGPGGAVRTIYWAHNAHVSAASTSWGPTGALLRSALGCGYRAVATTFDAGAFIAQVPNDAADRLAETALPAAGEGTIERVLARAEPRPHIAAWRCGGEPDLPSWLAEPRPLRWIGALYAPDTLPSGAYRPYRLTAAFDAIVYLPRVGAEPIPAERPVVPPRP
jgi:erythromycin esterase